MLVQEAFRTLKFLVSTMLEKHGIGELSKHFIIRKNIFFGVQILRKVRQDNGESRRKKNKKKKIKKYKALLKKQKKKYQQKK